MNHLGFRWLREAQPCLGFRCHSALRAFSFRHRVAERLPVFAASAQPLASAVFASGELPLPPVLRALRLLSAAVRAPARRLRLLPSCAATLTTDNPPYVALLIANPASNISASTNSIPILAGANFKEWRENISIVLGVMDLDLTLRKEQPAALVANSSIEEKEYKKWYRANRMSLMIMRCGVPEVFWDSTSQIHNRPLQLRFSLTVLSKGLPKMKGVNQVRFWQNLS